MSERFRKNPERRSGDLSSLDHAAPPAVCSVKGATGRNPFQLRTILYATDLSDYSGRALEHAALLTRQHQASLHMMHVFDLSDEPHILHWQKPQCMEPVESKVRELTDEAMDRLFTRAGALDLKIVRELRRGRSVAEQIMSCAEQADANLIVMGTHGRRGLRRILLGSVATEVLRLSTCHVLTVRHQPNAAPAEATSKILVPLDLSRPSAQAVTFGKYLATSYGAEMQLLHVIGDTSHPYFNGTSADPNKQISSVKSRALASIHRLAAEAEGPDVRYTVHVMEGRVGHEIARFSEEHSSDLLVLATHEHSAVMKPPTGGATETIVRTVSCPVFTFKLS